MLMGKVRDDGSIDTESNPQPEPISKEYIPPYFIQSLEHYEFVLNLCSAFDESDSLDDIKKVSLEFLSSDGVRLECGLHLELMVDFYQDDDSVTNGQELKDKIEEKIMELR